MNEVTASKLSNSVKMRYVKDYRLPFQIVHEPMFSYYINELNDHFGTKYSFELLNDIIQSVGTEDAFFKESENIKKTLIDKIQSTKAYKELQNNKLENYNTINHIKQANIYTMENANKTFISLDLKQANFNVFKMFDPEIVLNFQNYDDLIGSVTDFEYFKHSKYLRQVIFGNLLPKKQQRLQKWVIDQIISVLHNQVGIELKDFLSASSDEVVFAVDPSNIERFVSMIEIQLFNELPSIAPWVRVDAFTLKAIGDKKFFAKENLLNDSVEFKGIQSYFFMQVYKKYMNKPTNELDRSFYHDGKLAVFKELLFEDIDYE